MNPLCKWQRKAIAVCAANGRDLGNLICETVCRRAPAFLSRMGVPADGFPGSDHLYNLLRHHRMTPQDVANKLWMIQICSMRSVFSMGSYVNVNENLSHVLLKTRASQGLDIPL